jgi:hypothetical protein
MERRMPGELRGWRSGRQTASASIVFIASYRSDSIKGIKSFSTLTRAAGQREFYLSGLYEEIRRRK